VSTVHLREEGQKDSRLWRYGDGYYAGYLEGTISGKPYSGDFRTIQVWVKSLDMGWQSSLSTVPIQCTCDHTYSWTAFCQSLIGGPLVAFQILDDTQSFYIDPSGGALSCPNCTATGLVGSGPLTFAAVAAPEPSSVALMLLGVGLVFVMRKHIGQRLPQAS
jgi:hypothetical protein